MPQKADYSQHNEVFGARQIYIGLENVCLMIVLRIGHQYQTSGGTILRTPGDQLIEGATVPSLSTRHTSILLVVAVSGITAQSKLQLQYQAQPLEKVQSYAWLLQATYWRGSDSQTPSRPNLIIMTYPEHRPSIFYL